jgi:hypothetical protein
MDDTFCSHLQGNLLRKEKRKFNMGRLECVHLFLMSKFQDSWTLLHLFSFSFEGQRGKSDLWAKKMLMIIKKKMYLFAS